MPHNLLIVDYSLGHPGSVYDAWAFQSTRVYQEHATLLQDGHWIWADSAYPLEPWCIPSFKKPLTNDQKTFNYHLSKVSIFFFPLLQFFLIFYSFRFMCMWNMPLLL
jgi:hypothetical protein